MKVYELSSVSGIINTAFVLVGDLMNDLQHARNGFFITCVGWKRSGATLDTSHTIIRHRRHGSADLTKMSEGRSRLEPIITVVGKLLPTDFNSDFVVVAFGKWCGNAVCIQALNFITFRALQVSDHVFLLGCELLQIIETCGLTAVDLAQIVQEESFTSDRAFEIVLGEINRSILVAYWTDLHHFARKIIFVVRNSKEGFWLRFIQENWNFFAFGRVRMFVLLWR